jgi:sialidase-1
VVTTKGAALAFCEGRKNSGGDSGHVELLVKRSMDGGQTWGAQHIVWSDKENTCGNPTPVVDQDTGIVWLLMTWNSGLDKESQIDHRTGRDTRRVFVTQSKDEGLTWAKPWEITSSVKKPEWRWYATGPGNGIQLSRGPHRGRLLIPANHSRTASLESPSETVSCSHVFFSDDHGKTWQLGGIEDKETNESTVAELSDGAVMQNMRTNRKKSRRAVGVSTDGGLTWSRMRLDETLIEPVCEANLLRCTWPDNAEKSRLLFANPASLKREKMTVRVSYDEGNTWPVSKLIYGGPAAYSALTVMPDKSIACLFECGETNSYETISLLKFSLGWLESAQD